MPVGFDQSHVMYVWFDALTNYLSGIHALVRVRATVALMIEAFPEFLRTDLGH